MARVQYPSHVKEWTRVNLEMRYFFLANVQLVVPGVKKGGFELGFRPGSIRYTFSAYRPEFDKFESGSNFVIKKFDLV